MRECAYHSPPRGGHGWHYDDPAAPPLILVCPATCAALEADPGGSVHVGFGGATVLE